MLDTIAGRDELAGHLDDPDWVIVDCRYLLGDPDAGARAYREAHIPGAVYADLLHDLSGPPLTDSGRHPLPGADRLAACFADMGVCPGRQVVAYDDAGGSIAARLWWLLRYMGHRPAAVLDGGWRNWTQAGGPVESGWRKNSPRPFRGSARTDWLVTLAQVPKQKLLVDSRDPARYRGELEPLDPVAGHIPGALNRCWMENLDAHGRFRPAPEIRSELLGLYGATAPADVVFYCGSGVTACHNLLAVAWADLPAARLYAGSWSEWCADPRRPVATGST